MEHSIFEQIQSAVTQEGRLPEDFKLPDEIPDNRIKFAPGAMDGIIFYHMAAQSEKSEEYLLLVSAIDAAAEGRRDEAIDLVYDFASKHHVLGFIDMFQEYVQENQDKLSVKNVINFAVDLILEGTKVEAVKFGMSLLELIDLEGQDQIKDLIRLLALSDEFTLYAAFLMRGWENPNKELFDILQKVEGWGRVHLVRMIEVDSEEIEEWLVRNGVHNDVVPAYSGIDCYRKVHYLERIQNPTLDLEDYRGLADILDAMLDEGPVVGISAFENAEEIMQAFFAAAKMRTDLEAQDYVSLVDLRDYIQEKEDVSEAFKEELTLFLQSKQVKETIQRALENGAAFEIARRLQMDYQEYAYQAVKEDFVKNAWIASCLIVDDYKVQEIIDLAYEKLHVESIASGAADEVGTGEGFEDHHALTMILQALRNGRIHVGENLIQPALKSPVVSNRNMALSVLETWMKASGKTIQEISPMLTEALEDGLQEEVREDVRKRIEQILKNCVAQTNSN